MMKLADLMEQNKELLATIDAWDNGKLSRGHCHDQDKADMMPNDRQDLL